MSDIMRPMAFEQLLNWMLTEKRESGTVFGEHHPYRADEKYSRTIFGRPLETPAGPAAGPHTQLAQNIVAAYYYGEPVLRAEDRSDHGRGGALSLCEQAVYQGGR